MNIIHTKNQTNYELHNQDVLVDAVAHGLGFGAITTNRNCLIADYCENFYYECAYGRRIGLWDSDHTYLKYYEIAQIQRYNKAPAIFPNS